MEGTNYFFILNNGIHSRITLGRIFVVQLINIHHFCVFLWSFCASLWSLCVYLCTLNTFKNCEPLFSMNLTTLHATNNTNMVKQLICCW